MPIKSIPELMQTASGETIKNSSSENPIKGSIDPNEIPGLFDFKQKVYYPSGTLEELNKYTMDKPYLTDTYQYKAESEPWLDKWVGMLNQGVIGNIVGGTVEGIGYLAELDKIGGIIDGTEKEFGNWLTKTGQDLKTWTQEVTPIYEKKPGSFNPGDWAWWFNQAANLGSTISLMIPAVGTVGILGKVGRGLKVGENIIKGLSKIAGGVEEGAKIYGGLKWLGEGMTSAVLSRHMENMQESFQVFDEKHKEYISKGFSDEEAKEYAAKGASETYNNDMALLLMDIPQYLIIGKILKGTPTKAGELSTNVEKYIKSKGLANKLTEARTKKSGDLFFNMLGEGFEEGYQGFMSNEGKRTADIVAGLPVEDEDYGQRINNYVETADFWNNFVGGAMGGTVFHLAGPHVKNWFDKKKYGITEDEKTINNLDKTFKSASALGQMWEEVNDVGDKNAIEEVRNTAKLFTAARMAQDDKTYQHGMEFLTALRDKPGEESKIEDKDIQDIESFVTNYKELKAKMPGKPDIAIDAAISNWYSKKAKERKDRLFTEISAERDRVEPFINKLSGIGKQLEENKFKINSIDKSIKFIEKGLNKKWFDEDMTKTMSEIITDKNKEKNNLLNENKQVEKDYTPSDKTNDKMQLHNIDTVSKGLINKMFAQEIANFEELAYSLKYANSQDPTKAKEISDKFDSLHNKKLGRYLDKTLDKINNYEYLNKLEGKISYFNGDDKILQRIKDRKQQIADRIVASTGKSLFPNITSIGDITKIPDLDKEFSEFTDKYYNLFGTKISSELNNILNRDIKNIAEILKNSTNDDVKVLGNSLDKVDTAKRIEIKIGDLASILRDISIISRNETTKGSATNTLIKIKEYYMKDKVQTTIEKKGTIPTITNSELDPDTPQIPTQRYDGKEDNTDDRLNSNYEKETKSVGVSHIPEYKYDIANKTFDLAQPTILSVDPEDKIRFDILDREKGKKGLDKYDKVQVEVNVDFIKKDIDTEGSYHNKLSKKGENTFIQNMQVLLVNYKDGERRVVGMLEGNSNNDAIKQLRTKIYKLYKDNINSPNLINGKYIILYNGEKPFILTVNNVNNGRFSRIKEYIGIHKVLGNDFTLGVVTGKSGAIKLSVNGASENMTVREEKLQEDKLGSVFVGITVGDGSIKGAYCHTYDLNTNGELKEIVRSELNNLLDIKTKDPKELKIETNKILERVRKVVFTTFFTRVEKGNIEISLNNENFSQFDEKWINNFVNILGEYTMQVNEKYINKTIDRIYAEKDPSVKPEDIGKEYNQLISEQGRIKINMPVGKPVHSGSFDLNISTILPVIDNLTVTPGENKVEPTKNDTPFGTIPTIEENVTSEDVTRENVVKKDLPEEKPTIIPKEQIISNLIKNQPKLGKDAYDDMISNKNDDPFRVSTSDTYTIWDRQKEESFINKILPTIKSKVDTFFNEKGRYPTTEEYNDIAKQSIPVNVVDYLSEINSKGGPAAWGVFKNASIYIYKNAARGTLYHEAFHAVFRLMLNDTERNNLLNDASKQYKIDKSDTSKLEEKLAEEFRQYLETENDTTFFGSIKKLFVDLLKMIKNVIYGNNNIDSFFEGVVRGKYKDAGFTKDISSFIDDTSDKFREIGSWSPEVSDERATTIINLLTKIIGYYQELPEYEGLNPIQIIDKVGLKYIFGDIYDQLNYFRENPDKFPNTTEVELMMNYLGTFENEKTGKGNFTKLIELGELGKLTLTKLSYIGLKINTKKVVITDGKPQSDNEGEVTDDNKVSERWQVKQDSTSLKDKLSVKTKLLLFSVPMINSDGQMKMDSTNMFNKMMEPSEVYSILIKELSDKNDYQMSKRLDELAIERPNFKYLVNRLNKNPNEKAQLISALKNNHKGYVTVDILTQFIKGIPTKVVRTFFSNKKRIKSIQDEWSSILVESELLNNPDKFSKNYDEFKSVLNELKLYEYLVEKDGRVYDFFKSKDIKDYSSLYKNTEDIKEIQNYYTILSDKLSIVSKALSGIGISIPVKNLLIYNKKKLSETYESTTHSPIVDLAKDLDSLNDYKDAVLNGVNPFDVDEELLRDLEKNGKITNKLRNSIAKVSDSDKGLKKFMRTYATISSDKLEDSFINSTGDPVFSHNLPNFIYSFTNDLKSGRNKFISGLLSTRLLKHNVILQDLNVGSNKNFSEYLDNEFIVANMDAFKDRTKETRSTYETSGYKQLMEYSLAAFIKNPSRYEENKELYSFVPFPTFADAPTYNILNVARYSIEPNKTTGITPVIDKMYDIFLYEAERIAIMNEIKSEGNNIKIANFNYDFKKKQFIEPSFVYLTDSKNNPLFSASEVEMLSTDKGNIPILKSVNTGENVLLSNNQKIELSKKEVLNKIKTEYEKKFISFANRLMEEGVIGYDNNTNKVVSWNLSGQVSGTDGMTKMVKEFFFNTELYNAQIIQLYTGGLEFYNGIGDFVKRSKEIVSPVQYINTSITGITETRVIFLSDFNTISNSIVEIREAVNKLLPKDSSTAIAIKTAYDVNNITDIQYEGYKKKIEDTVNADESILEKNKEEIIKNDIKLLDAVKNKTHTFEDLKYLEFNYNLNIPKLVNETDGFSFISIDRRKEIMKSRGEQGGWNKKWDILYDKIKKNQKLTNEEYEMVLTPVKPFYYGRYFYPDKNMYIPIQIKNAEYTLIPQLASQSEVLSELLSHMTKNNISSAHFGSTWKVGMFEDASHKVTDSNTWNIDTFKENIKNSTVYTLDNQYYGVQQETPEHHIDESNILGRQIRKLFSSDIPDDAKFTLRGEEFTKRELISIFNEIHYVNLKEDFDSVITRMVDTTKLEKVIRERENRQWTFEDLLDSDIFEQIRKDETLSEMLLDNMTDRKTPDRFRYAVEINKSTGRTNVSISNPILSYMGQSIFTSIFRNKITKQKVKGGSYVNISSYGMSDRLKIVFNDNGSIQHLECMLPFWSKEIFKDIIDENGDIDMNKIDSDCLELLGYRIPTEDKYSMLPLKVIGFMPQTTGGVIVLPSEITKIAGLDFDIDKYYVCIPESKFENGRLRKVNFNYKKVKKNLSTIGQLRQDIKVHDRSIRNNAIVDIIRSVLTHPSTVEKTLLPGGFENWKKLVGPYGEKVGKIDPLSVSTYVEAGVKNMSSLTLRANFVNDNNSHAVVQLYKSVNLDDTAPITFDGISSNEIGSTESMYIYDDKGKIIKKEDSPDNMERISKSLGSLVAGAVDIVKDPTLIELNINTFTAGVLTTMLKLGFPSEAGIAFINQPIIKKATKIFYNKGGQTKHFKETLDELKGLFDEKKYYSASKDISLEDMQSSLHSDYKSNNQMKILRQFEKLIDKSDKVTEISLALTADKTGVGPTLAHGDMFTRRVDTAYRINIFDSPLESESIDNNKVFPLMNYFYDLGIKKPNELLNMYFKYSGSLFKSTVNFVENNLVNRNRLSADEINHIYNNLLTFISTSYGYFDLTDEERSNIVNKFPGEYFKFATQEMKDKYTVLNYIELKPKDSNGPIRLQLNNSNKALSDDLLEKIAESIESMTKSTIDEEREIGNNLVKYAFFTSGFNFTPFSFMHVIHPKIIAGININGVSFDEFFDNKLNQYKLLDIENEDVIDTTNVFLDQYYRNNWQNDSLVMDIENKIPVDKDEIGNIIGISSEEIFNTLSIKKMLKIIKTPGGDETILPKYIKEYDTLFKLNEEETYYNLVEPLGVKNHTVEYNYFGDINTVVEKNKVKDMSIKKKKPFVAKVKEKVVSEVEVPNKKVLDSVESITKIQSVESKTKNINFQEEKTGGYRERTIKNASADVTIAIAANFDTPGEKLTKSSVLNQKKLYLPVSTDIFASKNELENNASIIASSIYKLNKKDISINIAGNGVYDMKNIFPEYTQNMADNSTLELLSSIKRRLDENNINITIRTGGQTGFDEAGAKAGIKLKIPTTILAPKEWKFRDITGKDIADEQKFKERFDIKKETKESIPAELKYETDIKDIIKSEIKPQELTKETIIDKSISWYILKDLPVYSDKGINTMRKINSNEHFGNPFTYEGSGVTGLIKMKDIPEAVQAYKDWLLTDKYKDVKPEQKKWILSQIEQGKLDNKTLLYMNTKEKYYSHADSLKDIVNNRITKEQQELLLQEEENKKIILEQLNNNGEETRKLC